jgi:hypothetical protein
MELENQQVFTSHIYISRVGWICADPCDPHPASFGYGSGEGVTWSVQPSLQSMQMDMALLRPGFAPANCVNQLFAKFDVDQSKKLDVNETERLLAEVIGIPPGSEYIKRAMRGLDRNSDASTISRDELMVATDGDSHMSHLFSGVTTGHRPIGVRGCFSKHQDSFYVDVLMGGEDVLHTEPTGQLANPQVLARLQNV